ncbi:hypothetical protein M3M33_15305, partial [Loigolactobacillus coryniformis]|uniref:hypothetical protein n=1 Tax=Loigolactobacillus coryniformis TaxID=1610 RepID=UPI00201A43FC
LDSPTLTSESMKLMTPEGVEAVKQHFIRKAATEARPLNMTGEYMPERFLSNTNFGETGPLLYAPDELARIGNIQEIIQANPRAYE